MLHNYFCIILLCIGGTTFGQTNEIQNQEQRPFEFSDLTMARIKKHYTSESITELAAFPKKCAFLQYYYSESFAVVSGQSTTAALLKNIDAANLQVLRKLDERTVVVDAITNLQIELHSLNEMDAKRAQLTGVSMQIVNSKL